MGPTQLSLNLALAPIEGGSQTPHGLLNKKNSSLPLPIHHSSATGEAAQGPFNRLNWEDFSSGHNFHLGY